MKFQYMKDLPASMPDPAFRILVVIWNHTDERGDNAYPSVDTIAAESGKSRSTTLRWLKWLRDNGWIAQDRRGGRSGDGHTWSSKYSITEGIVPDDAEDSDFTATHVELPGNASEPAERHTDTATVPSMSDSDWGLDSCWICKESGEPCRSHRDIANGKAIIESGKYSRPAYDEVPF